MDPILWHMTLLTLYILLSNFFILLWKRIARIRYSNKLQQYT